MIDAMHISKYDRPTLADRKGWRENQSFECLIYQCARDLATPKSTFHASFERENLRGLFMLTCNLVVNYTLMMLSNVIRRIENARPAQNPEWSPIPETRMKWQLENCAVDELRKKVLDHERGGKDEKEWFIGILLGKRVNCWVWLREG